MTSQQHADNLLRAWQLQRAMGIKPEDRKLEQDNEPEFYDWQLQLVAQQMDLAL